MDLFAALRAQPLIASVQASDGPLDDTEALLKLARASLQVGVRALRLEGVGRIERIRAETGAHVIGLVKKRFPGSDVYITPTLDEVDALLATGCEAIAYDATARPRPHATATAEMVARIHAGGALAMADCDSLETAQRATREGADLIGTTLAGYTEARFATPGPDLSLVVELAALGAPVIAEGRYRERAQVESAVRAGAIGVVVGAALNDPVRNTQALLPRRVAGEIGAIDIGGTWIRFGRFSPTGKLVEAMRKPLPPTQDERRRWIEARLGDVVALGVATGGVVHAGRVVEAKGIIPDHVGASFTEEVFGIPTVALNDGLATAWGHACLPEAAGRRVATLALGTGVGAGLVAEGRIVLGKHGEYPRLNDLPFEDGTVEHALGGEALGREPNRALRIRARRAFRMCVQVVRDVWLADLVFVCGGVGRADWLAEEIEGLALTPSPFGEDAGLYGAAFLALYPPDLA